MVNGCGFRLNAAQGRTRSNEQKRDTEVIDFILKFFVPFAAVVLALMCLIIYLRGI